MDDDEDEDEEVKTPAGTDKDESLQTVDETNELCIVDRVKGVLRESKQLEKDLDELSELK